MQEKKITQSEFVDLLRERCQGAYLKHEIEDFLMLFKDEIMHQWAYGRPVELQGFGIFKSVEVKERMWHDPMGVGKRKVGGHRKPQFSPSQVTREKIKERTKNEI